MDKKTKEILAAAGLLFVTAVWGLTFIYVKWTVAEIDVYYFIFLRFGIAALCLVIVFGRRALRIDAKTLRAGLILGFFLTAAYISQTEGLRYTTASNSAMITCLYMVLIPFCSYLYSRKLPSRMSAAGIILAVPGMYLLTQYSVAGINIGDVITVITAVAWVWHIIYAGEYSTRHSAIPLVVVQCSFTALVGLAVMLFRGAEFTHVSMQGWFTILVTAVFATCMGFILQLVAQRAIDPTRAGIIFSMEAVFGALFGWLIGGETMTSLAFAGACLMVIGMVVSEIHPIAKRIIERV